MKNKEKYAKEIIELAVSRVGIAMDMDMKPVSCESLRCDSECMLYDHKRRNCINHRLQEWAEQEYVPFVDWNKVPIDAPIEVSSNNASWFKRHFAGKLSSTGGVYVWCEGRTSYTVRSENDIEPWDFARLTGETDDN